MLQRLPTDYQTVNEILEKTSERVHFLIKLKIWLFSVFHEN